MVSSGSTTQSSEKSQEPQNLSPELVRKIADRVYQLMKEEARIDCERLRPAGRHRRLGKGGR
jgi:hypothetical protein